MSIKKSFGARIKEIREQKGLNQEQLAEIIGLESRHLSRIETGKSFTTLENIEKIATALNVDINTLFTFRHKQDKSVLISDINNYLEKADKEHLELAHKILSAIFN